MDIVLRIIGSALIATVLLVFLRERYPALAVQLMIAFVVTVFLLIVPVLSTVVNTFVDLGQRARLNAMYLDTVLRVIGVAYVASFGAQLCKDAKEEALAVTIELAGKVIIALLALPVLLGVLDGLLRLL